MRPYEPNDRSTWEANTEGEADMRRTEIRQTEPEQSGVSRADVQAGNLANPGESDVYRTDVTRTGGQPFAERAEDQIVVPLVEEGLVVNKQWAEAGEVVIRKEIETRTETVPVELAHEEVDVARVAVNRVLGQGETAEPRQEGDTLIIPVVEEELVVMKRLVVREEVHVTKRRATRREEVSEQVRSEQVRVETAGQVEQDASRRT